MSHKTCGEGCAMGGQPSPKNSIESGDNERTMFRIETATTDLTRPNATTTQSRNKSGVHVEFDNGWVVSIQWGPGTYSDNHDDLSLGAFDRPPLNSFTAEVAVWAKDGDWVKWEDGDSVQGWRSWEQVQAILDLAAADKIKDPIPTGSR